MSATYKETLNLGVSFPPKSHSKPPVVSTGCTFSTMNPFMVISEWVALLQWFSTGSWPCSWINLFHLILTIQTLKFFPVVSLIRHSATFSCLSDPLCIHRNDCLPFKSPIKLDPMLLAALPLFQFHLKEIHAVISHQADQIKTLIKTSVFVLLSFEATWLASVPLEIHIRTTEEEKEPVSSNRELFSVVTTTATLLMSWC